jgi:hypothetical protein
MKADSPAPGTCEEESPGDEPLGPLTGPIKRPANHQNQAHWAMKMLSFRA